MFERSNGLWARLFSNDLTVILWITVAHCASIGILSVVLEAINSMSVRCCNGVNIACALIFYDKMLCWQHTMFSLAVLYVIVESLSTIVA